MQTKEINSSSIYQTDRAPLRCQSYCCFRFISYDAGYIKPMQSNEDYGQCTQCSLLQSYNLQVSALLILTSGGFSIKLMAHYLRTLLSCRASTQRYNRSFTLKCFTTYLRWCTTGFIQLIFKLYFCLNIDEARRLCATLVDYK